MKYLAVLVFLLISSTVQVSAQDDDGDDDAALTRVRRGFGCPFNQGACHRHCQSIGRKGGYCSGLFKQTCTCYRH
uniref:Defensin n=1 Tax=Argas monolakensis TaxID=34602 RepID=Q09JJ7_ARGMO|nr:Defensin [Argas monolakensis]